MARKEFETLTPQMFYILVVLNVPRHGYEIMNEIMRITNDEIRVGAGTLYTLLSRFQNDGYIELVSEIDRKKIYQITKIGKYKLQEEKRKLEMQIKALNEVNQDKIKIKRYDMLFIDEEEYLSQLNLLGKKWLDFKNY